jgi:Uncharacterized protein conserved in bacteria
MSRIKEAIVLAMGILGLGAFLYCAMMHTKDRDRVVSVKGLSEREVKADFVIWPIVYKEVGNDLAAIHDAVQVKNAAIEKFLRENGVEDSEISRSAPDIVDSQGEYYGNESRPFRYVATIGTYGCVQECGPYSCGYGKTGRIAQAGCGILRQRLPL